MRGSEKHDAADKLDEILIPATHGVRLDYSLLDDQSAKRMTYEDKGTV